MIKRAKPSSDGVKITFTLPGDVGPVSVVGEFNDWDPHANPLKKRSNGSRSASVVLPAGAVTTFRYLGEEQGFFDDDTADEICDNGYGGTHSLIRT